MLTSGAFLPRPCLAFLEKPCACLRFREKGEATQVRILEGCRRSVSAILRVPAGFMRSKTQERIEELARERAVAAIDLALVEEGIETGKRLMAEMIANYPSPAKSTGAATATPSVTPAEASGAARVVPAGNGSGYLNEVSPLTVRTGPGEDRKD